MIVLTICAALVALISWPVLSDPIEDFYRGRNVNIIIGYGVGGDYDTYARLLGRHIGKHIPGYPSIVPQNMPGAGGLKATLYLANVAPKDGTVFGTVARGQPLTPLLLGEKSFDPLQFSWLGSVTDEASLCLSWGSSGIATWQDLLANQTLFGGDGQGTDPDMLASALNRIFGTKIKIITGYHSTRELTLGMERGEIEGVCGISASTLLSQQPEWVAGNKVHLLAQMATRKDERFKTIPLITDLAENEEQRQVISLVIAGQAIARPFFAPPNIPDYRKVALRAAFDQTMRDPEFLADAAHGKMDVNPMSGTEIEGLLKRLYATPKGLVAKASVAIGSLK
ncbi:MAG: Bug family tripartite tricarboxylate transporter substrate binding protein [Xanthobacteraceae bacterium]